MGLLQELIAVVRFKLVIRKYSRQLDELISRRDSERFRGNMRIASALHSRILRVAGAIDIAASNPWMRTSILRGDTSTLSSFCHTVRTLHRSRKEFDRFAILDESFWRTTQRFGLPSGPLSIEPITES